MKREREPELTEPRPKRTREQPGQPIPVPLASLTGQPPSNFSWLHYSGRLTTLLEDGPQGRRAAVVVSRPRDVENIWLNGYFGSLVQSRRWLDRAGLILRDWTPGADFLAGEKVAEERDGHYGQHELISGEVLDEDHDSEAENSHHHCVKGAEEEKGKGTLADVTNCDTDNHHEESDHFDAAVGGEAVEDSEGCVAGGGEDSDDNEDGADDEPRSWQDLKERLASGGATATAEGRHEDEEGPELYLDICEAFYLSYALGCLTVSDVGRDLPLLRMWQKYSQLEPDFIYRYAAYHYLRAKGWVVRGGHPLGCDWLVYRLGPPFYHASYTVRVEVVDGLTGLAMEKDRVQPVTWKQLLGLSRLSESVNKEMLVARVEVQGLQERDLLSPHCLRKLAVNTIRFNRWIPGEKRWEVKPTVPSLNNHPDAGSSNSTTSKKIRGAHKKS